LCSGSGNMGDQAELVETLSVVSGIDNKHTHSVVGGVESIGSAVEVAGRPLSESDSTRRSKVARASESGELEGRQLDGPRRGFKQHGEVREMQQER